MIWLFPESRLKTDGVATKDFTTDLQLKGRNSEFEYLMIAIQSSDDKLRLQ